MVTHHHYDHTDADRDINVVFPIDVLRDLEVEGFIGGIANKHIGYMGYTMQLKAMYEGTARDIAQDIDKTSRADARAPRRVRQQLSRRAGVGHPRHGNMREPAQDQHAEPRDVGAEAHAPRSLVQ